MAAVIGLVVVDICHIGATLQCQYYFGDPPQFSFRDKQFGDHNCDR